MKEKVIGYKYLNIECRNKIEVLYKEGYSARQRAKVLVYHHSTISRELKRTRDQYQANTAHQHYRILSKRKGRKSKITSELKEYIEDRLKVGSSPEQIVGRNLQKIVCFKTIYHWLYRGALNVSLDRLRRKGKSLRAKEKRGRFNIGKSISK